MNEINIYLAQLVIEGRLTHPVSENFLDYAYELCLNGVDDEEIESTITGMVEEFFEGKPKKPPKNLTSLRS